MGITSKAKNTLKSAYKSVKKSFNSFLKKLGFSSKEAAQVSSEFANAMSETIGNHLKDDQYREALKKNYHKRYWTNLWKFATIKTTSSSATNPR